MPNLKRRALIGTDGFLHLPAADRHADDARAAGALAHLLHAWADF